MIIRKDDYQIFMKKIIRLFLIISFLLSTCSKRTVFPGKEWKKQSPESQGVKSKSLDSALNYLKNNCGKDGIDKLAIICNGYLIYEGDSSNKALNIMSSTKSLTSTVLGLLIDGGKCTLDSKASEFEPLLSEKYKALTLRHFATMTSGYSAKGRSRWGENSEDWSIYPFDVDTPLFSPGCEFCYWDEAMMMFGRVLTKLARQDLKSFLDSKIMQPIGIKDYKWWNEWNVDSLAIYNGCTGIELSAKQLARFGYLFLNHGNWNGKQLISEKWVVQATQNQVPDSIPVASTDRKSIDGRGQYGFNWWLNGKNSNGLYLMPDAPKDLYFTWGHLENLCFVIPSKKMVVVRLGSDGCQNPEIVFNQFFNLLFN